MQNSRSDATPSINLLTTKQNIAYLICSAPTGLSSHYTRAAAKMETSECSNFNHICELHLHSNHNRRQFYDILYTRSITKEVDYGTCNGNQPDTDNELALISEWVAICEEIHFDNFVVGKHVMDDRVTVAIMRELGISFREAVDVLFACEDVYDSCSYRRQKHCICGEESKLYVIVNKNTRHALLVGSNCIKTVKMSAISSASCVQCGKSTRGADGRFGRCANCIDNPTFIVGSHKGQSIFDVATTSDIVINCIKDDKMLYDMTVRIAKIVRDKMYNAPLTENAKNMVFTGGKHIGKTFEYVYNHHRDYAEWIKSHDNVYGVMAVFKTYVLSMDSATSS